MERSAGARALQEEFFDWQCRIRRRMMREAGGQPSPGMRPRVSDPDDRELSPAVTVLLVEKNPVPATEQFRHIVRKSHDPWDRYTAALRILSAHYYQYPSSFADLLSALFQADSPVVAALAAARACVLHFGEGSRAYRLPCAVEDVAEPHPVFQAAYWHNHLFNPRPPPVVRVLAFRPDWEAAGTAGAG